MDNAAPFGAYEPTGWARRAIRTTRRLPDNWLARRLVIVLRRLALAALDGAPVDIDALGVRMRLRPYNNICEKRMLFSPQTFDPEELAILSGAMREGFVFIDIGANVGAYSLFVARRAGPSARVLAIEPQPDIFERLTYNIRLNELSTIKALDCAVADKDGDVTLFLDPRNSGESSVKVIATGGARTLRLPARTLLDLVTGEGYSRLDAVKLDVEGAEDLILEPFLADAPEHLLPSLLIIEDGRRQWQTDLVARLAEKGYGVRARTRLNLVFERRVPERGRPHA